MWISAIIIHILSTKIKANCAQIKNNHEHVDKSLFIHSQMKTYPQSKNRFIKAKCLNMYLLQTYLRLIHLSTDNNNEE